MVFVGMCMGDRAADEGPSRMDSCVYYKRDEVEARAGKENIWERK